eukprot:jgi/Picsp_1/4412/NSC_01918-R1_dual specificity protein phosphatase 12-like
MLIDYKDLFIFELIRTKYYILFISLSLIMGRMPTEVIPSVYISGVCPELQASIERFSHILLVLNGPAPTECKFETFEPENRMHVSIQDDETALLMNYFPKTTQFLSACRSNGGKAVVVCAQGVSRSVSVVVAYMTEVLDLGSPQCCVELLKEKHPDAQPNEGFLMQLDLWCEMKFSLDKGNVKYRSLCAQETAHHVRDQGASFDMMTLNDPASDTKSPYDAKGDNCSSGHTEEGGLSRRGDNGAPNREEYSCKSCRTLVATSQNVMSGNVSIGAGKEGFSWKKQAKDHAHNSHHHHASCSLDNTANRNPEVPSGSIFVEPLRWMNGITDSTQGKLYCPGCNARLGSFNWSGLQNQESQWITPGFQLHASKLDKTTLRRDGEPAQLHNHPGMTSGIIRKPKLLGSRQSGSKISVSSGQHSSSPAKKENSQSATYHLIFDCDGVMVDSERCSCEALRLAILEVTGVDIPHAFPTDFVSVFGMDVRSCIEHYQSLLLADGNNATNTFSAEEIGTLATQVTASKETHYTRLTTSKGIQPFPGIAQLIQDAQGSHFIPVGIASSGSLDKIRHNLTMSGLWGAVDPKYIVSAQEVQRGKPHPDVYLEAMRRLGCTDPTTAIVIEDAIHGIHAAYRAGIGTIFAVTTSLPRPDMLQALQALHQTCVCTGTLFQPDDTTVSRTTLTCRFGPSCTVYVIESVPSTFDHLRSYVSIR